MQTLSARFTGDWHRVDGGVTLLLWYAAPHYPGREYILLTIVH